MEKVFTEKVENVRISVKFLKVYDHIKKPCL